MKYFLDRFKFVEDGTFGSIADETGKHLCYTCERAITGDHPCVPLGTYIFSQYNSPTKGDVWITQEVPGRTNIEIHAGNTENDSLGCLLVGSELGAINGFNAVLHSKATLAMLKSELPNIFQLTIMGEPT